MGIEFSLNLDIVDEIKRDLADANFTLVAASRAQLGDLVISQRRLAALEYA